MWLFCLVLLDFQGLFSLEMGGVETLIVFVSELSFWWCKLLKNYGRDGKVAKIGLSLKPKQNQACPNPWYSQYEIFNFIKTNLPLKKWYL